MATRSDQIIDDAIRKAAPVALGGDAGGVSGGMTPAQALDTARRAFNAWQQDTATPALKRLDRVEEDSQVLAGKRSGQAKNKRAVTFMDLRNLAGLPSVPTAKKASGTVSAEQYNALVDDMRNLYAALGALGLIVSRNQ